MRKVFYAITVFSSLLLFTVQAQNKYSWTHTGPDNMGSKTRALTFTSEGDLLAGSASGGLWKSTNEGNSWVKVKGYTGNPNITSIVADGNTLMVATGETEFVSGWFHDPNNFNNFNLATFTQGYLGYTGLAGEGVYISTNGGDSWSNNNATTIDFPTQGYQGPFVGIQKLIKKGNRVFIASVDGLYYADNAMLPSGSLTLSGGSAVFQAASILDVEAGDGNVVYASTKDSLYISTDNGANFTSINDRLDLSLAPGNRLSFKRVEMAVSPSNRSVAYAGGVSNLGELTGIWQTQDNGATWKTYAPSGNPGFTPLGTIGQNAFTLAVFPDAEGEVIAAGNAWYTFTEADGWIQSAQHTFAGRNTYLPRPIHSVAFNPDKPEQFFIGTEKQIMRSDDRGETFTQKTKGYEATAMSGVAAFGVIDDLTGESDYDAVLAGTTLSGNVLNRNYNDISNPANQGYGIVSSATFGDADVSYLYPGAAVVDGADGGLLRTFTFGNAFETFYGFPISPQVSGLVIPSTVDTIVDRADATDEGTGLRDNASIPPKGVWVLNEIIPDFRLTQGQDSLHKVPNYIFFCSRKYVWTISYPLGNPNGLLPRWNRITNASWIDNNEFLTAITSTQDGNHTLYVGTSKGKLYRITNPHLLDSYSIGTNITRLDQTGGLQPSLTQSRWISSLAVDPANPERLVVTYGSYGTISGASALVWYTMNASATPPMFFPLNNPGTGTPFPIYTSRFIPDPSSGQSLLFLGTEKGLFTADNVAPGFANWSKELGDEIGNLPIYDIWNRRYIAEITDEDTKDFRLFKDNTVFIATHGDGVWTTADLQYRRPGDTGEPGDDIGSLSVKLYPNPSREGTQIEMDLPSTALVSVRLMTLEGKELASFSNETFEGGRQSIPVMTDNLAPGMYLLKVDIMGDHFQHSQTLKPVIVK
jgi:hypothetical protein